MTWLRIRHYRARALPSGTASVVRRGPGRWSWHVELSGEAASPEEAMRVADAAAGVPRPEQGSPVLAPGEGLDIAG